MASVAERVSVLETQVDNIVEKIEDVKVDVKEIDTKLVATGDKLETQLKTMYDASCTQHAELASKISEIEKFKTKWMYLIMGGMAVGGYFIGHLDIINKMFGN